MDLLEQLFTSWKKAVAGDNIWEVWDTFSGNSMKTCGFELNGHC